ncbi:MAG: TIGR03960 family B12-binding radical SAM protein [Planctomycetes bacterium]|nr:TIGR03960 family B12-binding radical SAM protein [Planctomycetota bacterium]
MATHSPLPDEETYIQALRGVQKPGRYIGGEINQVVKSADEVQLRWALLYPDAYEIGMPHQGLRVLYHCLNSQEQLWAERCFAPWPDFEDLLRGHNWPLSSLESRTPLSKFDVVAFTLQTELSYTNILTCLDLGGIPLQRSTRTMSDPLVVAGGAGALNPEVLADFIDLFFLGDGEEAVTDFSRVLQEERSQHQDRRSLLRALVDRCPYLYAPEFWTPEFDGPQLIAMHPDEGVQPTQRALVYDLENAPYPTAPVVPAIRTIHDRISLEIMRGCVQGCRFCQAGYEKRPQRFRSPRRVKQLAQEAYLNSGIQEIGLTSLSSSDHPSLLEIMDELGPWAKPLKLAISVPSLRVNEQALELPKRMADSRSRGLTLAPEVATDRLREIINKGIRDEDLYAGTVEAWRNGFTNVKLYFMLGIPGELDDDIKGIVRMSEHCSQLRREAGLGGPGQVHSSISTFVPKALTPFQWAAQARPEEIESKHELLKKEQNMRSVRLKPHDYRESLLEGFLSRADRRAGAVLFQAWKRGARFDAWVERIDLSAWNSAWKETGYGPEETAWRERSVNECLPWDHLDHGVAREYLEQEWGKAKNPEFTAHCQTEACGDCGVGTKTCVDIKAVSGLFEKFDRPRLVQRGKDNPDLQLNPEGVGMEAPLKLRSKSKAPLRTSP